MKSTPGQDTYLQSCCKELARIRGDLPSPPSKPGPRVSALAVSAYIGPAPRVGVDHQDGLSPRRNLKLLQHLLHVLVDRRGGDAQASRDLLVRPTTSELPQHLLRSEERRVGKEC